MTPSSTDAYPLDLLGVADTAWAEADLRWTNKPLMGTAVGAAVTVQGSTGQWYEFNVTDYVNAGDETGTHLVDSPGGL